MEPTLLTREQQPFSSSLSFNEPQLLPTISGGCVREILRKVGGLGAFCPPAQGTVLGAAQEGVGGSMGTPTSTSAPGGLGMRWGRGEGTKVRGNACPQLLLIPLGVADGCPHLGHKLLGEGELAQH